MRMKKKNIEIKINSQPETKINEVIKLESNKTTDNQQNVEQNNEVVEESIQN